MNFRIKILLMFVLMVMASCRSQKELIPVYNEIEKQSQSTTSNKENEVQKAPPTVNEINEKLLQELIKLNKENSKLQELLILSKTSEAKLVELEIKLSELASNKSDCSGKKVAKQKTWGDWVKKHSVDLGNLSINLVRLIWGK